MNENLRSPRRQKLLRLVLAALSAALSYVVFTFLRINIPLPGGGQTSVHLGNAIVVLSALLLGGPWGGLGGAVGLTIGDLFDPRYLVSAPKTFLMKFSLGLITGLVAHRLFHVTADSDPKHYFKGALAASVAALVFNAIVDPIVGYYYKLWILGKPAADLTLWPNFLVTAINSVISIVAATALYMALRPALQKAHLLPPIKIK